MAKPIGEFGGWLRFFQVTMLVNIIVMGIAALIAIIASMVELKPSHVFYMAAEAVQFSVLAYFFSRILMSLGERTRDVPERIIKILRYYMLFSLGYLVIEIPLALWTNGGGWFSEDSQSVRSSISTIFQYLIWKSYFTKSARVRNVYCQDISVQEVGALEIKG
jgi:hypothetical protein